ncbi:hypothetical protein OK016_07005 [Vibrio chagasii]|nr:hypothetical protein [Vibrio chagasii]
MQTSNWMFPITVTCLVPCRLADVLAQDKMVDAAIKLTTFHF